MIRYIVSRLLWGVVILVVVCAMTFVLFRVLPTATPRCCVPDATRSRS